MDTESKSFMRDDVIKNHLAGLRPVAKWLQEQVNKSNGVVQQTVYCKALVYMYMVYCLNKTITY